MKSWFHLHKAFAVVAVPVVVLQEALGLSARAGSNNVASLPKWPRMAGEV
jgi:hypothetical protein